jgi:hypothetical protein
MVVPFASMAAGSKVLASASGVSASVSAFWAVSCGCVGHARRLAIPAAACNSLSCKVIGRRGHATHVRIHPACRCADFPLRRLMTETADFTLTSGENGDTLVFSGPMTVLAGGLDARLREIETPIARIDLADVPMMDTVGPGPAGACRAIPVPKSSTHAKRRNA